MRPVNLSGLLDLLTLRIPTTPSEREQAISQHFKSVWPEAVGDLASFQRTTGCGSCRHRLIETLTVNPGKILTFLRLVDPGEDWDLTPLSVQVGPESMDQQLTLHKPQSTNMRGQIREIDDTPAAYSALYSGLLADRARYAGLSVCPAGPGRVKVYFF